jgi:DNA recombination protein RmuC
MGSFIGILLLGIVIGIAIGYLLLKANVLKDSVTRTDIEQRYVSRELYTEANDRLKKKEEELNRSTESIISLNSQLSSVKKEEEALNEKIVAFRDEIQKLHTLSQEQFENLANKILEEKTKKFTEQNQLNMNEVINPLRDKIKDFQEKVDKVYNAEAAERNTLKGEIKKLVELNHKISEDANNLATALKGDSKKQGNWGEIILEKVLERSGLEKGREYEVQYSLVDTEGARQQPDVVVFLPDNKHIIVDSKVSLVAYEAYVNAKTDEEKEVNLLKHVVSVKKHIDDLGKKNYQGLQQLNTPDFVLLFMPLESSFSIAIQADNELFNYAWDRKIVIVSPSTLLASLHTIASMWKHEKQNKNVYEIAEESGKLYDKFCGLIEDLITVGKKMSDARLSYEDAMRKIHLGPGNIVKRIENIKKLGAKTTKSLGNVSTDLVNRANEE